MTTFWIVASYCIIAVLFIIIIIGFLWEKSLMLTKAPFVPIPKDVLNDIAKALEIKPTSIVYDLGSGDGRVLQTCAQAEPKATYIGVEKEIVPFILSKWRLAKLKKTSKIDLICKDFFKVDLQNATHVFTYLFPALMDDLLPKLEKELKPGTRLVSCDFLFSKKQPVQTIFMDRPKNALAKKLHIYQF